MHAKIASGKTQGEEIPLKKGLTETVKEKHGLTNEEAEQAVKDFGG
ncbi:hypothetical protein ACI5KX_09400 [Erythrobacter sp. GH1-10]